MATENTFTIKDGVTVTEEVVAIIAGLAACEADGVDCIGNGLTAANISKAGAGKLAKGIRVIREADDRIIVRLAVVLAYGFEIPVVSRSIQEKVGTAIENMTGIKVKEVDVRISSVSVHS
ncbi:MAG: Asp23/Gls24 family envelope stress response protein [Lachnospiraceae bacterium]|nr:Asp23/Gls24 family envelope stress response protein [Lachnospiraceae bacterium]MBQ5485182.1 Asp23/Gls24 family envelope stress response protein [Lachnospiraceae bacterium]